MAIRTILALALAGTALTGCVQEARIAMPSDVAPRTDRVELRGIGAGTRGHFDLGGSPGSFVRGAGRASGFGLVHKQGGGRFSVAGPAGELSGGCDFREDAVKLGDGVQVTARPFGYRCDFERDGVPIEAFLALDEARGGAAAFRYARTGSLSFEGQRIAISSIHHFEGSKMPTLTPLGYAFEAEGGQIGAMDLNGSDKILFVPRDPRQREAVLAASLALAILWDPADSD